MAAQFAIDLNLTSPGGGFAGGFGSTVDNKTGEKTNIAQFQSPLGTSVNKVGANFATVATVAVKVAEALQKLYHRTDALANKMAEFSPEISQAQAINEVKSIQQSVKFAQENGKELADFVTAQGKMNRQLEELQNRVISTFTPLVTKVVDLLALALEGLNGVLDVVGEMWNDLKERLSSLLESLKSIPIIASAIEKFEKWQRDREAAERAEYNLAMSGINNFLAPDRKWDDKIRWVGKKAPQPEAAIPGVAW